MTLLAAYLGGAVLDALRRLAAALRWAAWIAVLVGVLLLLDG